MADRAELLARLASAVAEAPESQSLTWRLCDATRRLLGADGASISLDSQSSRPMTVCATDEVATVLEELHEVLGEGPATVAYTTREPVVAELRAPAPAWSVFAEAATRQTPAAVLIALPMLSGDVVLGVLSLYRASPGPLSEPLDNAGFLAGAVGAALLYDSSPPAPGDGTGWSDQAEVHQATGMVVAQLGIAVPDALAILRAHAFALDVTLSQVARAVVARDLDFTEPPP
ncbi:GAF and ANTAR domain-containing protein [Actinotalea sp. K2]|uniref:GAF and ANTAR domain-containing protein n=1 Tax=Actinotalea sp. K2 TaxID=2939438 RepID=UPI002017FCF0|nr:GAF and ANTAR domain-containing protein [Actinotalea sp. K2]MCL3862387.1 GAF and ANTAR domain-containing protein [Actinotalea sp. K2]